MPEVRIPKDNRRGRNPGYAVGQRPESTDARAIIVRQFDLSADQRRLNKTEAHRLGLGTLSELAEIIGVHYNSVLRWSHRHSSFPKPVARGHESDGYGLIACINDHYLYSADEALTWAAAAMNSGLVRKSKNKSD